MSVTVDLPGGYHAVLRDPKELRERHRRLIQTAMAPLAEVFARIPRDLMVKAAEGKDGDRIAAGLLGAAIQTRQEANAMAEMQDAVVIALLESWDRPDRIPTMDNLTDLEPDVYAALSEAAYPHGDEVMKAALQTSFDPTPGDVPSPFGPSGNLGRQSKPKGSGARSTGKRRTAGASTATAP